jgi:hypothetical protein
MYQRSCLVPEEESYDSYEHTQAAAVPNTQVAAVPNTQAAADQTHR